MRETDHLKSLDAATLSTFNAKLQRSRGRPPAVTKPPTNGATLPLEAVQRVLSKLSELGYEVQQTAPGQWEARCPAHDDDHASLSIHAGEGGKAVLHCHAGCTVEEICEALGLQLGDLFPSSPKSKRSNGILGRIVAEYDYCDEHGIPLYQSVRYADPKDFRQRRPNGKGGRLWNLPKTVRHVLYRLPELLAADPAEWVFVVEGEKDVDRLRNEGCVATCNVGGAGKWLDSYSESLRGFKVCIIADKDDPGRKHAQKVAKSLHGVALEVKVVECSGEGVKDASDWFDAALKRSC